MVGTNGKGDQGDARMAYDYLKANARKIGIDRDVTAYDLNIQVMSLMQGKDATTWVWRSTSPSSPRPGSPDRRRAGGPRADEPARRPESRRGAGRQAPGRDGRRGQAGDVPDREPPRLRRAADRGGRHVADRPVQRPGQGGIQGAGRHVREPRFRSAERRTPT